MKLFTKFKANWLKLCSFLLISLLPGISAYAQLSGTYTVGSGGNYSSLTAAISALNTNGVSGPVTLSLTSTSYSSGETFPIVINSISGASSTNKITIKPASGVSPTISGSVTTAALIKLNGADYITIDGSNTTNGTSRDLTITNTGTNAGNGTSTSANAVIWIANASSSDGALYNTIKNCKILGSSTTNTHMVIFSGGNSGIGYGGYDAVTPNSYNVISNNFISKATFGIWLKGNNATKPLPPDISNQIINNTLGSSSSGDGFETGAIIVQLADGALISGNDVANVVGGGGTPDYTNSGSSQIHFGIHVRNSKNVKVYANKVHNIEYNGSSAIYTHGIHADNNVFISSSDPSSHTIANNLVYDIRVTSNSPTSWNSSGITLNAGYGDKVYFNTVYMTGQISVSTGSSAAFNNGTPYNTTATAATDVRNNIFVINGTSGSSTSYPRFYAHYTTLSSYSGHTVNYNDYYTYSLIAPVHIGYFNSTSYSTLSAWKSATSQDANSISTDPNFPSSTNLRTLSSVINNSGTPISGITTDFEGKTRNSNTPDMGAYEFTPSANDIRMTAIVTPLNGDCAGTATKIGVAITNDGSSSQSNIPLTAILTGGINATLTATYTKTIVTNTTDTFYFTNTYNTTGGSTFTITAYSALSTDADRTNDTAKAAITLYAPPAAPTAVNGARCTPGQVKLTASKGSNQKLRWYTTASGGSYIYEGDTFTTKNLTATETFYVEALINNCAGPRSAVTANIYKKPEGSSLVQGSTFQGKFNTGTSFDRDIVCTGGTAQYALQPPTGLQNSDYGTKWTLTNFSFTTDKGTVPTGSVSIVNPSSSGNGTITFTSSSKFEDSFMVAKVSIKNIITGCDTIFSRYLYVAPQPKSDFSFLDGCTGSSVVFTDKSTISKGTFSYAWDFGDGNKSNAKNPQYQYAASGVYTVSLKITSFWGCVDSIAKNVTVNPSPLAAFTATDVCQGTAVNFSNSSTITSGSIAGYSWDFGDGNKSAASSPSYNYAAAGTYKVKLVATSALGCKDSLTKTITVKPSPKVSFSANNVCIGEKVNFTNTTQITPASTTINYFWDFGDGNNSQDKEPSHIYTAAGTYTVKLIGETQGLCSDFMTKQVTVGARPAVKMAMTGACQNRPVSFIDSSTLSSGTIASRTWNFGDGGTSLLANPTHTYKTAGTYTVKLKVTSNTGCADSITKTITINAIPAAAFTATSVCMGEPTVFTNTSTAASPKYLWSFGDGDTSSLANPSHTYKAAGTFKAMLLVINATGCADTLRKDVTVKPIPSASFSVKIDTGRNVVVTPAELNHTTYAWEFGDGNTSNKVIAGYKYKANGNYRISLTVTGSNGCTSKHDTTISINTVGVTETPEAASMKVEIAPNPFSNTTLVKYNLENNAKVKAVIYDISGKEVAVLADQNQAKGQYTYPIDAEIYKMNAGIYLLRIAVDNKLFTKQIIRVK